MHYTTQFSPHIRIAAKSWKFILHKWAKRMNKQSVMKITNFKAEIFFLNGPFPASFSLFLSFQFTVDSKQMFDINKFWPMTGFEPPISGIGSNRSTNWATTTSTEIFFVAHLNVGAKCVFVFGKKFNNLWAILQNKNPARLFFALWNVLGDLGTSKSLACLLVIYSPFTLYVIHQICTVNWVISP